jgi:hypothetical protein
MEEFCDDGDELSGCIMAKNSFIKQIISIHLGLVHVRFLNSSMRFASDIRGAGLAQWASWLDYGLQIEESGFDSLWWRRLFSSPQFPIVTGGSRDSDWLRAGRPKDRSSSASRGKNFLFSMMPRPVSWPIQSPIPCIKATEAWSWPLTSK